MKRFAKSLFRLKATTIRGRRPARVRLAVQDLEARVVPAAEITATLDMADNVLRIEGTEQGDTIQVRHAEGRVSIDGVLITVVDVDIVGSFPSVDALTVSAVDVKSLAGNDGIFVEDLADGTSLTINAGFGQDVSWIHERSVWAPVSYDGGTGATDYLYIYDLRPGAHAYTVTSAAVTGPGINIPFVNTNTLSLYSTNDAADTFDVQSILAGSQFHIWGYGGDDTYRIGGPAGLDAIRGNIFVAGFNGTDTLTIDNNGGTAANRFEIEPGQTRLPWGSIIDYSNTTEAVTVRGGAIDETFALTGSSPDISLTLDGGSGANTLEYLENSGLAAWYRGDGNAADTAGGNGGQIFGTVNFAPGRIGEAFQFPGYTDPGYVRVPNAPALEPTTVSVEVWVNSTTINDYGAYSYIVSKGAADFRGASYALVTSLNGGLWFYIGNGSAFQYSADPGTGIWDGQWHHVVGTFDGSYVRLYVDGAEIGSGTPAINVLGYGLPDTNDLFIGTYNGLPGYTFEGLIDEPSVYNRALTPGEVQSLFANGKASAWANGVSVNLPAGTATGVAGGINNIRHVIGATGNDTLTGDGLDNRLAGRGGNDALNGADGADVLDGGDGSDALVGGGGDDTYAFATAIVDETDSVIEASGSGVDTLDFSRLLANDPVAIILFSPTDTARHTFRSVVVGIGGTTSIEGAIGGAGNDVIRGNARSNWLWGGAGNDSIYGQFMGDALDGGDGNDYLSGDAGSDNLVGGEGDDTLDGGGAGDTLWGGFWLNSIWAVQDNDQLYGDDGDDQLYGGAGDDRMAGQSHNDYLQGDGGNDTMYGDQTNIFVASADGNDTVHGGDGNDTLDGSDGADRLVGENGNDYLNGGYGADELIGCFFGWAGEVGGANDTILGSNGPDSIFGGDGADSLVGENGSDLLVGDGGDDVLDGGLLGFIAETGGRNDTLFGGGGNDRLWGGEGQDSLTGDSGADTLMGEDGADDLDGGLRGFDPEVGFANDSLDGGAANDLMWGGEGNDTLVGGFGQDTLNGESGADHLDGGLLGPASEGTFGSWDLLDGGTGDDRMWGGEGFDTLIGGFGSDTLNGESGADLLDGGLLGTASEGAGGADVLDGGRNSDTLWGGEGNDILRGLEGNDRLNGEDGDDTLYGGAGLDNLDGGWGEDGLFGGANDGNDTLTGGGDGDRFLMPANTTNQGATFADEDSELDFFPEDARPIFLDGWAMTSGLGNIYTAQNWTDRDIERTDAVLALLQREAPDTRLLDVGEGDLVFVRHGGTSRGFNDGMMHFTDHGIQFGDTDANDKNLRGYILHEIGHYWQGNAFQSAGTTYWNQFIAVSDWRTTNPNDPVNFNLTLNDGQGNQWYRTNSEYASDYARNSMNDDFAESFTAFFTQRAGWTFYGSNSLPPGSPPGTPPLPSGAAAIPLKIGIFNNWLNGF